MVQNWFTGALWRTIDVIDKDACWNYKVENKWRLFFIGCLFELEIFTDKRYDNAEHLTTFLKKLSHVASSDVTWRHMTLIFHKGLYICWRVQNVGEFIPWVITYQKAYEQTILTRGHTCQCEFWLSRSDHFNIDIKYISAESRKFHTNREKLKMSLFLQKCSNYLHISSITIHTSSIMTG